MPKLIYTPKALDDLQGIKAYVATALFTGDPLKVLLPVLVKLFGHIWGLVPLFQRRIDVVPFDAFLFMGTVFVVPKGIDRYYPDFRIIMTWVSGIKTG